MKSRKQRLRDLREIRRSYILYLWASVSTTMQASKRFSLSAEFSPPSVIRVPLLVPGGGYPTKTAPVPWPRINP